MHGRALKVGIVLNSSWNVYNFRRGLIRALQGAGHEVVVIAPRDAYSDRLGAEFHHVPLQGRGMNPFHDLRSLAALFRLYRSLRLDVALHFTPKPNIYGSIAARLSGVESICNIAGLGTVFTRSDYVTWIVKRLYALALRFPRKIFFQNLEDMDLFIRDGLADGRRADRVPGSGVDLNAFRPSSRPDPDRPPVFLLISRLLWEKGVGEFAEAARILKAEGVRAEFRLQGFLDPSDPKAVPAEAIAAWEREGILSYSGVTDDVSGAMAEADCIVLPSFYREGVPRVLLEAAGMGLPIITTDSAGCRDVVVDGLNGFTCRGRDAADLAGRIRTMAGLPRRARVDMGLRGRERMEALFDERIILRKYLDALEEIRPMPRRGRGSGAEGTLQGVDGRVAAGSPTMP